jgi:UDP-N-acetylmuramoyl-L-alanyl-D-glutamate--2,6-diaminopimelate ligase
MNANAQRTLVNLLKGFGAPAADVEVTGIEMDSRRVSAGDLFLACKGHGAHGLAYLEQALERGAAAVAWEPAAGWGAPEIGIPEVAVPELSLHAGEIAARFYGQPTQSLYCVGITGTDGKTSTAYLVAQALDRLDIPCAYIGTLGNGRIGRLVAGTHTTPDPVALQRQIAQLREQHVAALAMEVSSHALDQQRVAGVKFDTAVLTNITRDHLDYHGTVENYARAKRRLFERPEVQHLVLNRDDEHGRQWARELGAAARARLITYGLDGEAPDAARWIVGRNLRLHGRGLDFDLDTSWGDAHIDSRLLGRFNAYNLMAALAALLARGTPLDDAVSALAQASTVPGRIEGFRGARAQALVVVDYAHTPEALAQILTAVRAHTRGKLHCVFGCGGDRDRGKRPLMGAAAAQLADDLIITDDNPRSEDPEAIVGAIREGAGAAARTIHDRALAIRTAVAEAAAGDSVVVAGKGHEDTQIYGSEVRHFSDREFVASLVGTTAAPFTLPQAVAP